MHANTPPGVALITARNTRLREPPPPRLCPCQILLLEAYEQLENDVSKEVDRALARQAEEVARLQRRVDFLQGKLEQQDEDAEDTRDAMAELEGELRDAVERNKLYEQGVYGLPQVCVPQGRTRVRTPLRAL